MYLKPLISLKGRRIIASILLVIAICVLCRSVFPLFNRHYFTPENFAEQRLLRDRIGRRNTYSLLRDTRRWVSSPSKNISIVTDRVKEQEKAREYFKLQSWKTDHCNFSFLIEGATICQDQMPFLMILVPSLPHQQYNRQIIRETWGQFSRNNTVNSLFRSKIIKLAFLLGRWTDNKTKHDVLKEKKEFGDIIVGDFEDSYKNLTRKILFGLKWMSIYCGEADFILKVDEDIYINIPKLVDTLTRHPANMTGSIYGHLYTGGRVERHGRWAVSREEFPLLNYPPYMSGNAYVISGATAPKLLYTSKYLPYLPIEDAFITGVLPRVTEISQFHVDGFTSWRDPPPDPCTFFLEDKISGNKVNIDLMKKMWLTQNNFHSACSFNKTMVGMLTRQ